MLVHRVLQCWYLILLLYEYFRYIQTKDKMLRCAPAVDEVWTRSWLRCCTVWVLVWGLFKGMSYFLWYSLSSCLSSLFTVPAKIYDRLGSRWGSLYYCTSCYFPICQNGMIALSFIDFLVFEYYPGVILNIICPVLSFSALKVKVTVIQISIQ